MARGGYRPGSGRPPKSKELTKGRPSAALLREYTMEALDRNGGPTYLAKVARTHPAAFLALLGKAMTSQAAVDPGASKKNSLHVTFVGMTPTTVVEGQIIDAEVTEVRALEDRPGEFDHMPLTAMSTERKAAAAEWKVPLDSAELDEEKKTVRGN